MMRLNVLNALEQLMDESYFHCEWAIEWQEQRNAIELLFQINLDNPNQRHFWKEDKTYSNDKTIVFMMSVLLYDTNMYGPAKKDHTALIPFDFKKGIEYGECFTLVKYLKILSSTIPVKWTEFLTSGQSHAFSVEWDWDEYNQIKNRLIESNRYSHTLIYFPN